MFTIMRNVKGNRSPLELEEYTLGDHTSAVFSDALALVKESSSPVPLPTDGHGKVVSTGTAFIGTDEETASVAHQISCVEITVHDNGDGHLPKESIAVANVKGINPLDDAIGVLTYALPEFRDEEDPGYRANTVRYEFFYPGDQVFVTNSHGRTVDTLR
ncbi:hypothetical protein pEaSNUABM29_00156 [Erwinia phage pEa_SNUABM_29]|nr:hypothetical protein pEaSNUABM29_00156 [Erwinia phage pEa_SNUABM_29]